MFKKIFYSLTILAMLFGMFGVMGTSGVKPVYALSGVNELATSITATDNTPLPTGTLLLTTGVNLTAVATAACAATAAGDVWIPVAARPNPWNLEITLTADAGQAASACAFKAPAGGADPVVADLIGVAVTDAAGGLSTVGTVLIPAGQRIYVVVARLVAATFVAPAAVALAERSIFDTFATSTNNLPYHGFLADFNVLGFAGADPATTCIADPSASTGWETVTTGPFANFLHVHSYTEFDATIAVFNDNLGLGTEVDCQNSGAADAIGSHSADLVVPVLPNTIYHVYIAPRAFGTDPLDAGDKYADLWIGQFVYGGGIIANLCQSIPFGAANRCDQSDEPLTGATVQAQLSTGGTIYTPFVDGAGNTLAGYGTWTSTFYGDFFVDVPDPAAGTSYTLGISSLVDTGATPSIDTIWFVPAVASFVALDPDDSLSFFDSLAANHSFLNVGGAALAADVEVAAAGGVLPNFELPLGTAAIGLFRIIPGGFYDFEAILPIAAGGTDYYLISKNVDCLNVLATCPLAFNTSELLVGPWPLAHPHASIDRRANVATLADDFAVGATGTNFATSRIFDWNPGDDIVVSAGVPLYMDSAATDIFGDIWVLQATTPGPIPSTMVANTALTHLHWDFMQDMSFLITAAGTEGDLFTTLTAPGLFAAPVGNEVPWTSAAGNSVTASYTPYVDNAGNILIARSPIDLFAIDYFPDYWGDPTVLHRATTNDPWVEAWQILGDDLGEVDPAYVAGSLALTGLQIGRDVFLRCVAHDATSEVFPRCLNLFYAISPTDTRMSGHWSWSWVEGMYELLLTNGTAPGVYSPDMTISRAEMAVFLSRLLSYDSAILPAGAGVGGVYTDVLAGFWASGYIEQLKAYNISGDCNPALAGNQFCPDAAVTRAEMAKFIEQTFRVANAYGMPVWWDENFNVITPGQVFVDVPAGNWAAFWIDELAFDQLTEGCRTEMSGLANIYYFCPDDPVTRGQMAKFIVSAFATVGDIQDGWPILAPER